MSWVASVGELEAKSESRGLPATTAVLEVVLLFTGVMAYIWRWQRTYPHAWVALWVLILISHVVRHDTLRGLGLAASGLRDCAQWILPLAALLFVPMLLYGFIHDRIMLVRPNWNAAVILLGYGSWCVFQQYLTQSYFNNRLMLAVRNRHVSSALIGIMFSATHIPNVILMVATLVAGFIFAELFARYRNIWPLALAQAVGGLLLAAISPEALIHHMRVGPGYFFYGIR